jgi:hypothetical protein
MTCPAVHRLTRAAVVAGCLSLIVACGNGDPTPSSPASPSGSLSASAAPAGTANPNLAAFEGRIRDATAREGLLVRSLAAASAGTAADMRLAIAQVRDWVAGERDWLAGHPADACYQAAADAYIGAVDAMEKTADLVAAYANASAGPVASGAAAGEAAGRQLNAATDALHASADLATGARAACR